MNPIADVIAAHLPGWRTQGTPLILGICGTQASGKSTASAQLAEHFSAQGWRAGVMSLDDLYLGRKTRAELAANVHPLFATRGPPGTHNTRLGVSVLDAVKQGNSVALPRFSKRDDEPLPEADWPRLEGPCDLLIFEGWCVGAIPQGEAELLSPVNALEREDDAEGIWRRAVNTHLAGETGAMFSRLDRLVYLRPPGFDIVLRWRCQQEHEMIARDGPARAAAAMTDAQIARFIAHYERLTRHMAEEMPSRADLTLQLGPARQVISVSTRGEA